MATGDVTLLQIRTAVRQRTDNTNSLFLTDAELNSYIQSSYQELYGFITQEFGNDYFVQGTSPYTFVTDGINSLFALPDGSGAFPSFFKLLGVDLQISSPGQWVTLKQFAFADRNRLNTYNTQVPQAGQTIRVFYVPKLTLPTLDADLIPGVNGWEELIILDCCIKALAKEESDVSVFAAQKSQMEQRLASEVENRNASGSGGKIVDVLRQGARGMQYRLNGNSLWLIGGQTPGFSYFGGDWDTDGEAGWW